MIDGSSLLQRIAVGDRTAVDDCIDQYGGLIWSIGKRYLCDNADLEDATQEVFIELWQQAGRFDPKLGTEVSFVALIARRRMTDRLRRSTSATNSLMVQSIDDDLMDQASDSKLSQVDAMVWGEEIRQTANCLAKLDSVRRKILVLHLRDGQSHRRIADLLQLPLGTIKSHARRGLLQVQRCVGLAHDTPHRVSVANGDMG